MVGFGAAAHHSQAGQIQPPHLVGRSVLDRQRQAEVGREGHGRAVAAHRFQPEPRREREAQRRQEGHRAARQQRCQHETDQPHVVVHRQPAHAPVSSAFEAKGADDGRAVGEHAGVRDPYSFGRRRAARGELQEHHVLGEDLLGLGRIARQGFGEQLLRIEDLHPVHSVPERVQQTRQVPGHQECACSRRAEDVHGVLAVRLELAEAHRRAHRDRDDTGRDRAQEGEDELLLPGDDERDPVSLAQAAPEQLPPPAQSLPRQLGPAHEMLVPVLLDEGAASVRMAEVLGEDLGEGRGRRSLARRRLRKHHGTCLGSRAPGAAAPGARGTREEPAQCFQAGLSLGGFGALAVSFSQSSTSWPSHLSSVSAWRLHFSKSSTP
ncbi:hypothetical protein A4R44_05125 [Amycolatopsis sp. M39]|nr:hypothetical protein A4R44_05125 [Amycolatopsis sp. M39]